MPNPRQRHKSRQLALQGLYQLQLSENPPDEIEERSKLSPFYLQCDTEYFHQIFQGITQKRDEMNKLVDKHNLKPGYMIDPIMRAILHIGLYELSYCPEIDHPIIITEAVKLSQEFLHEESHSFANSILDQAARTIRS